MLTNSIIYDYYLTINMSYFVFFYFFVCESTISMGSLKYVQCSNISYETNNLMIISESIINHKIQKPWDGTLNYYYSHDLFMFLFCFFLQGNSFKEKENHHLWWLTNTIETKLTKGVKSLGTAKIVEDCYERSWKIVGRIFLSAHGVTWLLN